ncbi:15531_t:CDS:2 [Gigaspora rosea]|nr:15531_t:CDS:2 [Gigaspora rosea]
MTDQCIYLKKIGVLGAIWIIRNVNVLLKILEDVEYKYYKWCKYCDEVGEDNKRYKNRANHNSQNCKYKLSEKLSTTNRLKLTKEWKMEKIKCSICSTKKWIKCHSKEQRCSKSKEQIWNDCWLDIDELKRNIFTLYSTSYKV